MTGTLATTDFPDLRLVHRGKVRDTYTLGDLLLMVATDRLSAYDVVLPTAIPDKGKVLTGLSVFWFSQTSGLVPNHLVTADVAEFPEAVRRYAPDVTGRSMIVRRAERIDVECVVRGYLAGSAWAEYQATGTVGGEAIPPGLCLGDRLPEPLFTPALKVDDGHDVNVSRSDLAGQLGSDLADTLELTSLNLYLAASELAAERRLIVADTKFEFGFIDEDLTVIDELLTPDSSRYWDAEQWAPGRPPASFDKQFVRDWLTDSGWNKEPPGPDVPPDVVAATRSRYLEVYRRLTGYDLGQADEGQVE